jgi:hypothetical protein
MDVNDQEIVLALFVGCLLLDLKQLDVTQVCIRRIPERSNKALHTRLELAKPAATVV